MTLGQYDQMYDLLEVEQPRWDSRQALCEAAKKAARKRRKRKRHRLKTAALIALAVGGMHGSTKEYDHATRAPQSIGAVLSKR